MSIFGFGSAPKYENLSPHAVAELLAQNACYLVDVRTPREFIQYRIAGAHLLPIQELAERSAEIPKNSGKTIVIICEHGIRSANACATLTKSGWTNCANMSGGMAEWLDCTLPVASGREPDAVSLRPIN